MVNQATVTALKADGDNAGAALAKTPKDIKVTIYIPEHVRETTRRQKINTIYDILKPSPSF